MSHVATVDVEIKNLDWLEKACRKIGLEFVRGQTEYRWFGTSVGDLGKCAHAIRLPLDGSPNRQHAYEIGVVPRRDGKPGWSLMWDFYRGGKGMEEFSGKGCSKLVQAYTTVAARETAQRQGMRVTEQQMADGSIRLMMSK